VFDMHNM